MIVPFLTWVVFKCFTDKSFREATFGVLGILWLTAAIISILFGIDCWEGAC